MREGILVGANGNRIPDRGE